MEKGSGSTSNNWRVEGRGGNGSGRGRSSRGRGFRDGGRRGRATGSGYGGRGGLFTGANANCNGSTFKEKKAKIGQSSSDESDCVDEKEDEKKSKPPVFGFRKLYNFLSQPSDEVLLSINRDRNEWTKLLESDELNGDMLVIVLEILGEKVSRDHDDPVLRRLQANALNSCFSSKAMGKLEGVVTTIMVGQSLSSRRNPMSNAHNAFPLDISPAKVMKNIYDICNFIMTTSQNNGADYFQGLIAKSIGALEVLGILSDLKGKFQSLAEQINEVIKTRTKTTTTQSDVKIQKRKKRFGFSKRDLEEFDKEIPPDHIRHLSIIPNLEEIINETYQPYLRPNKASGAYNDSEHYLDVQFRLLKEDFVQPLRKGIQTFLKDKNAYITGEKKMPFGEVRLYKNVQIVGVAMIRENAAYKLQFASGKQKKTKEFWEKSKKLLTGTLVVLTTQDNSFRSDTTYFGVIVGRNVPELVEGIVSVSWEDTHPRHDQDKKYLMFESDVYFEAYRHTLETLQFLSLEYFPMKKFIVDGTSTVEHPSYFRHHYKVLKLEMANGSRCLVSNDEASWPAAKEFGLEEDQLTAFRAALTKEFSIVQGPPGTGKTFLGLKVLEALLDNSSLWEEIYYKTCCYDHYPDPDSSDYEEYDEDGNELNSHRRWRLPQRNPITVVCYTNHALDQFLEGILNYFTRRRKHPSIVRIGGRSESTALSEYSLQNVRHNGRALPKHYWESKKYIKNRISTLEEWRHSRMDELIVLQNVEGIYDFKKSCVWRSLQRNFLSDLWEHFQELYWFGIDDRQMMNPTFSQERVIGKLFQNGVSSERKVPEALNNHTMRFSGSEDKRAQILLESKTSERSSFTKDKDYYLPNCSVANCNASKEALVKRMEEKLKESPNEAENIRRYYGRNQTLLQNREMLLEGIFRLYKKHSLYLPDVTDLLQKIKEEADGNINFEKLRWDERWALYFRMVEEAKQLIVDEILATERLLSLAQSELREIIGYEDILTLRGCQVVGLTTTGAAKYNDLLQKISSKIVIVEEAAEVLESHIVTSITENCEHLILIGDHKQLRPNPAVYELAVKYNLDLSLFERMLNNNLHCYQLKKQHRMRPDISDLVIGTIYDELLDGDKVKQYPDVRGLTKSVFFLSHKEKEKSENDTMSKSNEYEADFIAALCHHLILQGYSPDQITILTMYVGQQFLLRKKVDAFAGCHEVRVTCVDNFQGEENDIILLSLVRSNDDGKIGFLNIDNRICVALSRAKHGLYIVGNMEQMEAKNTTWKAIKEKLEKKDHIGDVLKLECQAHGTIARVRFGHEFNSVSPVGGCTAMCEKTLPCSHKCHKICHGDQNKHECREPCPKLCGNELHPCKGKCSQPCRPCKEIVERTFSCGHVEMLECLVDVKNYKCKVRMERTLSCGHVLHLECHKDPKSIKCEVIVPKSFSCGHSQDEECWKDPNTLKCVTEVTKVFTGCGHETVLKCSEKATAICKKLEEKTLPCGHQQILECNINVKGVVCKVEEERELKCGHRKVLACHVDLKSYRCKIPVPKDLPCGHSKVDKCWKTPGQVKCDTMVMKEFPLCGHDEVEVKCSAKEKLKCMVKCATRLDCGHKCTNTCHLDADPNHRAYKCKRDCNRKCDNDHKCETKHPCSQPCPPCKVSTTRLLKCGHEVNMECSGDTEKQKCFQPCKRTLTDCGHKCTKMCLNKCEPCQVTVTKLADCGHDQIVSCSKPASKEDCEVPVAPKTIPGCGHEGFKVPCKAKNGTPEELAGHCQKPCDHIFSEGTGCNHKCTGSCGRCMQGRVHVKCMAKCERKLVCGHKCESLCHEICPPCQKSCPMKCEHMRKTCKKKCGEPCAECKEKCPWICPHARCHRLCGEPCDREPCNEPCPKKLKCGHNCVGFCGELCPPLCRICDKKQLAENLLGSELKDARFVYLVNCKHTIEVKALEALMMPREGEAVGTKGCPKCKSPIRNCRRFNSIIRKSTADIIKVKARALKINAAYESGRHYFVEFQTTRVFPDTGARIQQLVSDLTSDDAREQKVIGREQIDKSSILSLDFIYDSAGAAATELTNLKSKGKLTEEHYCLLVKSYRKLLDSMLGRHPLGWLEVIHFNTELDRMDYLKQLMIRRSLTACSSQNEKASAAQGIITSEEPFTKTAREKFLLLLKELDTLLQTGLEITTREKCDIRVHEFGMREGDWFKCPKNHVFVRDPDEHADTTEKDKCSECCEIESKRRGLLLNPSQRLQFRMKMHRL